MKKEMMLSLSMKVPTVMLNEMTFKFNPQSAPITLCIFICPCWFNVPEIKHQEPFYTHETFEVWQKKESLRNQV